MSLLEWAAALVSMVNVYLAVRNNIWNWGWGVVAVVLYGVVFYQQMLWANMWLQFVYFLPIQGIGWWVWLRGGPKKDDDLPVTLLTSGARLGWAGVTVALSGAIVYFLTLTHDPQPWADGITTGVSIVAQYLQVQKRWENWLLWLGVDIAYVVFVFVPQHLYVSAGLYALFCGLAFMGARQWWGIFRTQVAPPQAV